MANTSNEYFCGLSFWHPKWLQKFATMKWFLAVYGLLGTVQGISYIYLVVTLTTMEKRFHMPSQTTGIVLSGNEISQILLSLILSYAGGQKNRPQWIAWGLIFCGISCFVLALPHFMYGLGDEAYHLTKEYYESIGEHWNTTISNSSSNHDLITKNHPLCKAQQNVEKCNNLVTIVPLVLIFLSQFILGVGNTLYYSLGQTYVDDNTKKVNTPLLFAIVMALRMVGPTIGFGLGTLSLNIFIDPTKTPLVNRKDPRWLGAWWFGWILLGFIMFVFSGLLALFPKRIPDDQAYQQNSDTRQLATLLSADSEDGSTKNIIKAKVEEEHVLSIQDFCKSLRRVVRNKIVIFNNISGIFYILGASGYVTYLGRYMEVQFNKTSQNATSFVGPLTMLGMVLGLLVSGWILSRKKPHVSKVLFWNVIIGCIYAIGQFSYLFFYCGDGTSMSAKEWSELTFDCNRNCHCDNVKYSPVCHRSSGHAFFSPCHAGCYSWDAKQNIYTNCSCANSIDTIFSPRHHDIPTIFPIPSEQATTSSPSTTQSSLSKSNIFTPGLCTQDCMAAFYAFSFFTMLMTWLNATGKIGNILVNYRAVVERDKAFAQGLTLMMLSLFAFIPGPIIFGKVIDSTCLIWNTSCGKRGDCLHYDQTNFRYYVNTLAVVLTTFGVIFDTLVWYYGRKLDFYMDSEKSTEREENRVEN